MFSILTDNLFSKTKLAGGGRGRGSLDGDGGEISRGGLHRPLPRVPIHRHHQKTTQT